MLLLSRYSSTLYSALFAVSLIFIFHVGWFDEKSHAHFREWGVGHFGPEIRLTYYSDQEHSPVDIQCRRWEWTDLVNFEWLQTGFLRRGHDAGHDSSRIRAVDEWRRRLVLEGVEQQWERVHADGRVGRMSRMPAELGSMVEFGKRGKEDHASVNNNHQDMHRFWGEEQFEPRGTWSCGQTPLYDAGRRWWVDACENLVWPRGIRHPEVRSDGHCQLCIVFFLRRSTSRWGEMFRSLSSWNPGGGLHDSSTYRKTDKEKSIPKCQRPTEGNTVLTFAGGDSRSEIPTTPTKNPKSETMTSTPDDAELLKGFERPGQATVVRWGRYRCEFLPWSLKTIRLFCVTCMDDKVDTSPDKCHRHRAIGEVANPRKTSRSRYRRFSTPTKLLMSLFSVQRQISPRTTETEHQWHDRSGEDAGKDVQIEAITNYSWSERENAVNIYLELDGLDDVTDDAFKVQSGKTNVSLTIASVAGKHRIFKGARNHRRLCCAEERKTNGLPEVRVEGKRRLSTSCSMMLSTKEVVADDSAKQQHKYHISCQPNDTESKNLEVISPTKNEEEIDNQKRSMDSHKIQCVKEYCCDLRAGTDWYIFLSWQNRDGTFSESILEQGDKERQIWRVSWRFGQWLKLRKCWRCGLQTQILIDAHQWWVLRQHFHWIRILWWTTSTVTTSSLITIGTQRKLKNADDDRMQVDSL